MAQAEHTVTIHRSADANTATVTFRLSAAPSGIMRLFGPEIAKQMRVETRQLDNLKAELERR